MAVRIKEIRITSPKKVIFHFRLFRVLKTYKKGAPCSASAIWHFQFTVELPPNKWGSTPRRLTTNGPLPFCLIFNSYHQGYGRLGKLRKEDVDTFLREIQYKP